ncbi:Hypothetical predicted protein [Olea europaea subsp. europaea]|uniref:Uncharacterized protein n=1 Tax=Olea europaea subsp. europaea TaxID=158383 RepID=A0A8S0QC68_OLEEU|nr:Hypothetical predicted protein [Olea europaea subsp. europaea]
MDFNQASSHLQIFISSPTPAVLVMLYMSFHKPNGDVADDAIRRFISSIKYVLPKNTHYLYAPIVLEFCKLLNRAKWTDDPLYTSCQIILGKMVEWPSLNDVQDFTVFVVEAMKKIKEHVVGDVYELRIYKMRYKFGSSTWTTGGSAQKKLEPARLVAERNQAKDWVGS